MRLINILEQGKKAISANGDIYSTNGVEFFKNDKKIDTLDFNYFTRGDFDVLNELEENFTIDKNSEFLSINLLGCGVREVCQGGKFDTDLLNNFNAFPKEEKEFMKYLNKLQLLERKLMVFSRLNHEEETSKTLKNAIFSIEKSNKQGLYVGVWTSGTGLKVYFNSKKVAEACLARYRGEIEEVLELKEKFKV